MNKEQADKNPTKLFEYTHGVFSLFLYIFSIHFFSFMNMILTLGNILTYNINDLGFIFNFFDLKRTTTTSHSPLANMSNAVIYTMLKYRFPQSKTSHHALYKQNNFTLHHIHYFNIS